MESLQKQTRIKSLLPFSVFRESLLKETDLNEVARMVEGVLPQHMHVGIGAKVTLSEEGLEIMADTVLMQQALIHLVKNAVDAMPDGGTISLNTGRVHFEGESLPDGFNAAGGACAFLTLADTGIGIDEKIKGRIFGPFFTTKTGGGEGLGLPIAYRIIREHGGSVNVESTPGQGTKIHIYLPLAKSETANAKPIPLLSQHDRAHSSHSTIRKT
jgi:two-component system, cell cycle sensor histidine kinase and response regulator CckA